MGDLVLLEGALLLAPCFGAVEYARAPVRAARLWLSHCLFRSYALRGGGPYSLDRKLGWELRAAPTR